MQGEITSAIAGFAASPPEAPAAVRDRACIHVLDSLGLALAGSVAPVSGIVRGWLRDDGVTGGGAAIFGSSLRAPPRFAAFANAAAIHADNFDDTAPQIRPDRTGGIHASASVLPAVLALAETAGLPGRDAVTAYMVGVEIAARLNHAAAPDHYAGGFHVTGTLAVFGVAAAAARLTGAAADGIAQAVGIAASRAAGVRRNFGTATEILHPAQAAEAGIAAAALARRGVTAAADALDGPAGYLGAAGGGADAGEILGRLGTPWAFENPGLWIKPHPCGALTHPAAGCLAEMMARERLSAADIAAIRVRTNRRILDTLLPGLPANPTEARFSMAFVLAVVAVERRAGLAEFTAAALRRADIRAMMRRVEHSAFDREEDGFTNVTTFVTVDTADGRNFAGRADHARGSAAMPFGPEEARAKFADCAAFGRHPPDKAAAVPDLVAALDREDGLGRLCAAMSR